VGTQPLWPEGDVSYCRNRIVNGTANFFWGGGGIVSHIAVRWKLKC